MSMSTFLRLGGGIAMAIVMYLYLPMLDIINLVFVMLIGLVWLLIVVDVALVGFGVVGDLTQGISAWGATALVATQNRVKAAKEDLATRVEEIRAEES